MTRSPWAPDAVSRPRPPIVGAHRWQATVDAAGHQCSCEGECGGHPETRCGVRGEYDLHAVPAHMLHPTARGPFLIAVCDRCHGRLLKHGHLPQWERAEWDVTEPTARLTRLFDRHQKLGVIEGATP